MVGKRFGKLTVIRFSHKDEKYRKYFFCKCDCGEISLTQQHCLRNGNTKSCGCLRNHRSGAKSKTGVLKGMAKRRRLNQPSKMPKIYLTWSMIKQRCLNPNHHFYDKYKERGITVAEEWLKFENFYKDMNEDMENHLREHGLKNTTLMRIDTEKGYSKDNCKWATNLQQGRNKKSTKHVEINGVTKTLSEWYRETGLDIRSRIMAGWKEDELLLPKNGKPRPTAPTVLKDVKFFMDNKHKIKKLPERNIIMVTLRYGLNGETPLKLEQIGNKFNLTRERVRQIIAKSKQQILNF